MGFLDVLTGKRKLARPAPDRLFAISTAYVTLETELEITLPRSGRDRVPAALDRRLRVDRPRHGGGRPRHRRGQRDDRRRPPTTATASAGSCSAAATSTTSWSGSTRSAARSRPAATASGCCARCSPSRTPQKRPLYWIYNYKRGTFYPFVPAGGARAARQRARARAQGADRQGAAGRAGARALVPAVGHPDLTSRRSTEKRVHSTRPRATRVSAATASSSVESCDPPLRCGRRGIHWGRYTVRTGPHGPRDVERAESSSST